MAVCDGTGDFCAECTGTLDLVPLPPTICPITFKWVYKIKTRTDGSLEHYKARLVAHVFKQEHGRDYDETFAPMTHMTTTLTLLVVAFVCHWSVSQLDVKNAFLNGELHEEVFMQPPYGYFAPDGMIFVFFVALSMALSKLHALGLSILPLW
jgi:hypothetical protein